ncbi:hypothetical protein [Hymenobacter cellulosilyticus]|uniref:Uncharacterized protein n=1 Tax=Hymenobacter cellulosilyticus TaxID=2932248 RepID=A0A8T9Q9S7_9BACT|nr:hypothetical protein [Hymenobacter cellulosilyticus]UOQ72878.1 hypothetical protein MUN79_02495 [Hymenobacter cellulosilyticus]
MNDPDYVIKGTVYCLIDTDTEILKVEVKSFKNLFFKRLLNKESGTELVNVDNNTSTPPTEIEDCLNPRIYYETLKHFTDKDTDIEKILNDNEYNQDAKNSSEVFDLKDSEKKLIKGFFDKEQGENKVTFAKKYIEISKTEKFKNEEDPKWILEMKSAFKEKSFKESKIKQDSSTKEQLPKQGNELARKDQESNNKENNHDINNKEIISNSNTTNKEIIYQEDDIEEINYQEDEVIEDFTEDNSEINLDPEDNF